MYRARRARTQRRKQSAVAAGGGVIRKIDCFFRALAGILEGMNQG